MDAIFNMHKIKYVEMREMLRGTNKGSVQIFINLEPIMRKLISAGIEDYLKTNRDKKLYEMISNILNLAAHYRKYFSNEGRSTEVIMYMSGPKAAFVNGAFVEDYRIDSKLKLYDKRTLFGRFMEDVIPLVKIMTTYFEGVYFITSDIVEPSLLPMITSNHMSNKVLITTERYEYQYADHGYYILRPKKNSKSYLITKDDVIDRMKIEDKIISEETVPSNFIPFILSFLGDPVRGIPKVKGVGLHKIIRIIRDGVNKGYITENTNNLSLMEDLLVDDIKNAVKRNFLAIDLKTQLNSVGKSTRMLIDEQKVDKFDNVSLKKLNEYFKMSPIMLDALQPLKEKKSVFQQ